MRRPAASCFPPTIFWSSGVQPWAKIELVALAMKSIAHPLRLKILCVLADGELSVQDIVEMVGTSQSNISQHLAILRDKDVLVTRKDANRVYYRIGDLRILKLVGMMRDVFCSI